MTERIREFGKPRTLILCFDGTSNEYDPDNTNVIKLFALLKKDNFDEQLCYYQAGVGTWFEPGVVSPVFEWGAKVLDLAFAWYLDAHVINGYKFLMQNYRVGDKICLFGFSRGAYTASALWLQRALAGLLYKVGLLPRDNEAQVSFAYKMYKRTDEEGLKLCAGFKQTFCQEVKIEFMGVWDTVASVGVIMGRTLPFTNSNESIKTFRHALSLDERRAKFRPNRYHRPAPNRETAAQDPEHDTEIQPSSSFNTDLESASKDHGTASAHVEGAIRSEPVLQPGEKKKKSWGFGGWGRSLRSQKKEGLKRQKIPKGYAPELMTSGGGDDVLEVWFAGCHSDVGGGAVVNEVTSNLANISLRWMVREIVAADCGIKFDIPALMRAKLDLNPAPSPVELEMDSADALQPVHDQLKLNVLWWLLEIIPLHYTWQDADGVWHRDFGFNFGKGREIIGGPPNFHVTVKQRMQAMGYAPRARWPQGTEVYVA
ncbi:hypothetical protein CVT24_010183 [Panaeolus cyanescens]|uniref:T6SS Phospholipase effector Tle1-like catalytic domain-containing protein n=1 Tax=Panaeolus cyanescens TaxID=181874 RepID=A0A409YPV6_9AGAR|nr:hypothetical protein CVT24_010183 [Panaeolus cyanescens]